MSGIAAVMRGMQRAMRGTTRAMRELRRAVPSPRAVVMPSAALDTLPATTAHDDLTAAMQLIDADRLDRFARTLERYSRTELAEIAGHVAEIPAAVAAVAAQFDDWQRIEAATDTRAAVAEAQRLDTSHAAYVVQITARDRERRSLSLRRASRELLRPLSPRSPGLPVLA